KYGIFLFKTIVPLVVTTWIIIVTIILSQTILINGEFREHFFVIL
ncbi:DUF5080 family protein, partial [Staphylococcus aureus]|nr:DUF5080 family protein [Staphylococcus aureus]